MELYEVQRLVQRVSDLESRVEALEEAQINPYNIVSFTAVAVAGQMNLKPIQMDPVNCGLVSFAGEFAYRQDVEVLQLLAKRHKLL
jgi:hypothetical protein